MHGISPAVDGWGGAEIGRVGRFLGFAEKPSIENGKKHVELDNTKKAISVILATTDLCHPLPLLPTPTLTTKPPNSEDRCIYI